MESELMKTPAILILCSLLLSACLEHRDSKTSSQTRQSAEWINDSWPRQVSDYRTTNSRIYLANLNASIERQWQRMGDAPTPRLGTKLAQSLHHRFSILGQLEDARDAESLILDMASEYPGDPLVNIAASRILYSLHRFEQSARYLRQAVRAGASSELTNVLTHDLNRMAGLSSSTHEQNESDPLALAQSHLQQNRFSDAIEQFRAVELNYSGTDPHYLAWLQLQQGIAFLRYDDFASARAFFQAAHERFPEYYLVTEHLAETEALLGNHQRAAELYRQVSLQTDHPLFHAQLAQAEQALGDLDASRKSARSAEAGFQTLLSERPELIADHAVGYFLDNGETERALILAREQVRTRQDVSSWVTLAEATAANEIWSEFCRSLNKAKASGERPIELHDLTLAHPSRCL